MNHSKGEFSRMDRVGRSRVDIHTGGIDAIWKECRMQKSHSCEPCCWFALHSSVHEGVPVAFLPEAVSEPPARHRFRSERCDGKNVPEHDTPSKSQSATYVPSQKIDTPLRRNERFLVNPIETRLMCPTSTLKNTAKRRKTHGC